MRVILYLLFVVTICSCSGDENNVALNPEDSAFAVKLSSLASPVIMNQNYVYCGTFERLRKELEKSNWAETFEQRLECENYLIKKKNFFKFIELLNRIDSFSIPDFEIPHFFDNFEREQQETISRQPVWIDSILKIEQEDSTWLYLWYPIDYSDNIWIFPSEIFILKTGRQDSVPLKLQFNADFEQNITMTLCTDSTVSKKISKILTGKRLAKRTG